MVQGTTNQAIRGGQTSGLLGDAEKDNTNYNQQSDMSRKEDFKKASQSLENQVISNPWTLFEKGCEYGYQYAVEKACEWLEKNMFKKCEFDEYSITQTYACSNDCDSVPEFVEQIRKAMEE